MLRADSAPVFLMQGDGIAVARHAMRPGLFDAAPSPAAHATCRQHAVCRRGQAERDH
jgi:hypothetical protein